MREKINYLKSWIKAIVLFVCFFPLLFLAKEVKALLWYFIFKPKVRQFSTKAAADPKLTSEKSPTNGSLWYVSKTACSVVGGSNSCDKVLTHYLDVVKN